MDKKDVGQAEVLKNLDGSSLEIAWSAGDVAEARKKGDIAEARARGAIKEAKP